MLSLSGYGRNMSLVSRSLFLRRGTSVNPAVAAVVADVVDLALVHPGVVNVVDRVDVHVIHSGVVVKMPVVPASALVATTEITVAIVDPAVETYVRSPVTWIEKKPAAAPTPIVRGPEVADLRSQHPCSRYPVIAAISPSPVPRSPDIAVAGAKRLVVDGQCRRRDSNGYADLRERRRRHEWHCYR